VFLALSPSSPPTVRSRRARVDGSLYLSLVEARLGPDEAERLVRAVGARLDMSRDVQSGDRFRLVFAGDSPVFFELLASAGERRFYRVVGPRSAEWQDVQEGAAPPILLRTPVDGARVTSGFGMRLHPLLGYSRMHQGLDFGAPAGTPVLAAGDGVVEEARWAAGYGSWLKVRHRDGLETGYAHLSGWAPGIDPGAHVRQGQVVAYVGSTGLATGPHLHYEVFDRGERVDPATVRTRREPDPAGQERFLARKAVIDALVAQADG
jgi:murein DD-endopeptidase MepM/ murein hydrolase activator NlpD